MYDARAVGAVVPATGGPGKLMHGCQHVTKYYRTIRQISILTFPLTIRPFDLMLVLRPIGLILYWKHRREADSMTTSETARSRTITWEDPVASARQGRRMSGLDYLTMMQKGELPPPPISQLIGMRVEEVSEGRIVFALEPDEYHYNPIGMVHGGITATLLDSALGCAVHSVLPMGVAYSTIELKVNYLRAIKHTTGTIYGEGNVIYVGGKIATAEGRVTDASGQLYAHGTTTCLIMRPRKEE